MDIKIFIYLALAIGYYIFKFIKKQQERRKQQMASANPDPVYSQNKEVVRTPQKSTLDDMFKEFGMETTETYERPEVRETNERKEVFKTHERAETNPVYERSVTTKQIEIPSQKKYQSLKAEKNTPSSLPSGVETSRKSKSPNQIAEKLKSKSELKRAFIYTEIFKTKF